MKDNRGPEYGPCKAAADPQINEIERNEHAEDQQRSKRRSGCAFGGTVNLMVAGERIRRGGRSGGQAATAAPVTAAQTSKALARLARYWSAVT